MSRPRIGLTLDADTDRGRYELRATYVDAVLAAGGLPILLPHLAEAAGAYLALLDGLVVTGGAFDVPPELYGEARRPVCGALKPERTGRRASPYSSGGTSKAPPVTTRPSRRAR